MSLIDDAVNEVVLANRILANEGVVDAFGHVSMRHPEDPTRFLLSRSRSPEHVEPPDIMQFRLDGSVADGRADAPYLERFIHAGIYEADGSVQAVVHSHALEVLAFSISSVPLRPVIHTASHMGAVIPVWDIADRFGDTGLLVTDLAQGRDLAKVLGSGRAALMRGHGFVATGRTLGEVLKISIYLPQNARVLKEALQLGGGAKPLSRGEIEVRDAAGPGGRELQRAIDYWARKARAEQFLRRR
jgi:ribulose-5-phosphate 4-epimerase/fuculose-1-phosphate aldolase